MCSLTVCPYYFMGKRLLFPADPFFRVCFPLLSNSLRLSCDIAILGQWGFCSSPSFSGCSALNTISIQCFWLFVPPAVQPTSPSSMETEVKLYINHPLGPTASPSASELWDLDVGLRIITMLLIDERVTKNVTSVKTWLNFFYMLQCLFAIKHSKKDTSSSQCLWAGQGLSHIMPLTPFPYIWVKELPPHGIKWTLLPLCPNSGLIKLDVICWWAYLHQSKVKQWREGTVSFAHRRRLKQL